MKKTIISLYFLFFLLNVFSIPKNILEINKFDLKNDSTKKTNIDTLELHQEKDTTLIIRNSEVNINESPQFNYNGKTFQDYIDDSLKIPKKFRNVTFQYKVSFTIKKDGTVSNVKLQSFSDFIELDDLIYRIVKNQPNYIPAKKNGITIEKNSIVTIALYPQ